MKLQAPRVLEGYFWLPESTENLSGRLRISEIGKCSLELLGVFGGELAVFHDTEQDLSTIHGIVEGGSVTLYDCFYINRNIGFGTVAVSKVHVGTVFHGANLPPEAEVRVTKLEAVVSGLDEWLQITGIRSEWVLGDTHKVQSAFIHYVPQPKIELSLPGMQVAFEFVWTAPPPGGEKLTEAKITHQARLSVKPTIETSFANAQQYLIRLINFLSFAADQTLTIDELYAHSPSAMMGVGESSEPTRLQIFYVSTIPARTETVDLNSMLFTYEDIADRLEHVLTTWMTHHEALSPAFNLYFAVQAGRYAYLESAFLSIAQGLETLHDRTSDEAIEPPEAFEARVLRIRESCPDADRTWLEEQLRYANKPTLRTRLRHMLTPFSSHFGTTKERKDLVDKTVDTRNYFTHYDPTLEARAARGRELLPLTFKLQALFQLHLLLLVEINQERIEKLIASNRKLRYRMGITSN